MQKSNQTLKIMMYLSTVPLWLAMGLALYVFFDGPSSNGYFINFARINAYIYSHSYAALLLCVFAGVQMGMTAHLATPMYVIFNFCLLFMAWFSYHSFADAQGVLLLIGCWIAALLVNLMAHKNQQIPAWYGQFGIKICATIIALLSIIVLLNK